MHNSALPENFFTDTFGRRNVEIISQYLGWSSDPSELEKFSEEKEACYRALVEKRGLPLVGGFMEFLKDLNKNGIPCAIGSSTPRANLDQALSLLNAGGLFSAVASHEDVQRGKPAPDIFLCAARRLGVEPCNCCVFEDSVAGIDAAVAAGMRRVAVATTHTREFWLDRAQANPARGADMIIDSFAGLDAANFAEFMARLH